MHLVAAGLTFRSAPLEVRELVVVDDSGAHQLLRYLVDHCGLSGAAVMSTCNRTEFFLIAPDAQLADEVVPRLARYLCPTEDVALEQHIASHSDVAAVEHIFRVAAGLESMVVGEAQVLGQFKKAHALAREAGALDARLDFIMRRAITAGKRVRTETALGRKPGGLSDVAVEVARAVLGDLRGHGALLIGAGATASLAGARLIDAGASVTVASRSRSGPELARQLGGHAVELAQIAQVSDVSVIISCTSSPNPVVEAETIAQLQDARGNAPLLVIDLAVPRDVEPNVALIDGVELLDVDSLMAQAGLTNEDFGGDVAIAQAGAIVANEVSRTISVLHERESSGPVTSALTHRADEIRRRELEKTLAQLPQLDSAGRERIAVLSESLVRKLLHSPISHLRESSGDPAVALTIRHLFDLDIEEELTGNVVVPTSASR